MGRGCGAALLLCSGDMFPRASSGGGARVYGREVRRSACRICSGGGSAELLQAVELLRAVGCRLSWGCCPAVSCGSCSRVAVWCCKCCILYQVQRGDVLRAAVVLLLFVRCASWYI